MAEKVIIIHYSPLELFPPVTNFLNILSKEIPGVHVFSTFDVDRSGRYLNENCKIVRYRRPGKETFLLRLLRYFTFNYGVLFHLIKLRPEKILYYETYSSYPVFLYKKYFNREVKVYFHSHEYFSKEWWKNVSMRLMRWYYEKEKNFLYPKAEWLSQTNEKRLQLFLQDIGLPESKHSHIFPNYPPAEWKKFSRPSMPVTGTVRLVYVGSFGSLETLYISEIIEWIGSMNGRYLLDIYAMKVPEKIREMVKVKGRGFAAFKGEIDYETLPEILPDYHAGLILYKGTTANFVYNAPNKLFEYLVCGLDVFYPKEMEGIYPYDENNRSPRVLRIDFTDPGKIDCYFRENKPTGNVREIDYTCENASEDLIRCLLEKPFEPTSV